MVTYCSSIGSSSHGFGWNLPSPVRLQTGHTIGPVGSPVDNDLFLKFVGIRRRFEWRGGRDGLARFSGANKWRGRLRCRLILVLDVKSVSGDADGVTGANAFGNVFYDAREMRRVIRWLSTIKMPRHSPMPAGRPIQ